MRYTALFLIMVLMVSSCGGSSSESSSTQADVTVTIKDFKFIPDTVTLKEGQTVRWVNEDSAIHTATASNKAFDTGELYQGDSGSWTATTQGTYDYICSLHPMMKGKVIVE